MKEIVLKTRPSLGIGMLLGGICIAWIGIAGAKLVGGYAATIPGIVGLLGVLWALGGGGMLLQRNQSPIRLTHEGIELPPETRGAESLFIPRSTIQNIAKHESLRGRGVEIITKDGARVFSQIRHYCEIDDFLAHCRELELPIVQQENA